MATVKTRYSETDFDQFQAIVEKLLNKGMKKLERLEEDYKDAAETMENESDWMDDSSSQNDLGMLQTLVFRQRKHVNDLQGAMQRIYNKSYGICIVTGELIDKRRLMAVPTTTKSMEAKSMETVQQPVKKVVELDEEEDAPKPKPREKGAPVIITRVIKKPSSTAKIVEEEDDDDDDLADDDLDDLFEDTPDEDFDFDSIASDESDD